MPSPSQIWKFSRDFVLDFFSEVESVLSAPSYTIKIVAQDDRQLILQSTDRHTVINKRYKTVKTGNHVLARFEDIKSIDITSVSNDEGPATWRVSLNIGWFSEVNIGRTTESVDATIIAARLSTFTGKKVRAL